jgi:hypothetical protein
MHFEYDRLPLAEPRNLKIEEPVRFSPAKYNSQIIFQTESPIGNRWENDLNGVKK